MNAIIVTELWYYKELQW